MTMRLGLALSLLLLTTVARAEVASSPQHIMFEMKFGPYVPNLDKSLGMNGKTPFSDLFGDPSSPKGQLPGWGLLGQGEIDYQFFQGFGILGIGISAGYQYRTTKSFALDLTTKSFCTVEGKIGEARSWTLPALPTDMKMQIQQKSYNDCISDDEDKLNVVPMSLRLSYRFDVLDKRFRIPLIPYVKVGLAYYVWWFGNSSSYVASVPTKDSNGNDKVLDASGGSLGLVVNPGLALDLSAIDPAAARAIDQEIGLNRMTAFFELNYSWVNGFGREKKLNLSDAALADGLGFSAGLGFEL